MRRVAYVRQEIDIDLPRWGVITKAPNVLCGMGLTHLTKNESAKKELAEKGMALG
jgi:hypothetical protein